MARSTTSSVEKRLVALEQEVAKLKAQAKSGGGATDSRPWWEQIWGTFANDPAFEEAMRYGREYRESLRPKPLKKHKPKGRNGNGHPGH